MHVKLKNLTNNREFAASFSTKEECDAWVMKHKQKGADEKIFFSPQKIEGAEVLGEQNGPLGKTYKLKIPAEYTVEYIDHIPEQVSGYWKMLRDRRNEELSRCDWTQLADAPVDGIKRRLWRDYRQYLRDLPTQYSDETVQDAKIKSFEEYVLWKHKKKSSEIKAL